MGFIALVHYQLIHHWTFAGTPLASQELFSSPWTRSLVIETPGNDEFRTLSDDGIQLFVGNSSVIANTTIHAPTYDYGSIALAAGIVLFKVYYSGNYGLSVAELSWKLPGASGYTPINSVPGPLPPLGAGAAFHASRRLRQRVKKSYSMDKLQINRSTCLIGSNVHPLPLGNEWLERKPVAVMILDAAERKSGTCLRISATKQTPEHLFSKANNHPPFTLRNAETKRTIHPSSTPTELCRPCGMGPCILAASHH